MPRKDFRADLASASTPGLYSHLSDISEGEDDGSFCFIYTPPFSGQRISIHVTTSPDCSEYPRKHQFFAFSGEDSIPDRISAVLSKHQPYAGHPTIDKFLTSVTKALTNAVLNNETSNDALQQDEDEASDDVVDWDMDSVESYPRDAVVSLQMLRSDLQPARSAGYKVGFLGNAAGSVILSISYRIRKLSLSSDVLRAWHLNESEYLVLLIRYPYGYHQLEGLLRELPMGQKSLVEMHVGLCDSYKPSLACALQHFSTGNLPEEFLPDVSGATATGREAVYRSGLMGGSLTNLLNNSFLHLLRYRLEYGLSWEEAEDHLYFCQGKPPNQGPMTLAPSSPHTWGKSSPPILKADHLRDREDGNKCSFPLVAIQFVLQRFVRCTEFCLNCHRKIESGFQAIKPYVCSDGLCLYQYISLGMGATVEWEVLTQPYVVDLLVSLTYSRAVSGFLKDFPSSIGLKVPQAQPSTCSFNPSSMTIRVENSLPLKLWDLLLLEATTSDNVKSQWHCTVRNVDRFPVVEVSNFISKGPLPHMIHGQVKLYAYHSDFDVLTDGDKCRAIVRLLDVLPSVDAMRDYITNGSGNNVSRSLSSWTEQMSQSALYVLRWILASNRSYIVYEDNHEHMVSDMAGYLQFRIAQGTPDKESRFVQAVRMATSVNKHKQTYPTLFTWHGSPVQNWHSILREGLNYNQTVNGRSYGHGVYMASCFQTSQSYVGGGARIPWPHSKLKVTTVISLNEVVNSPEKFVYADQGFYVVNKLDWIQMRYLLVSTSDNAIKPRNKRPSTVYRQDPKWIARGASNSAIQVPMSATKTHRRIELHDTDKKKRPRTGSKHKIDADSVATLEEDIELLGLQDAEEDQHFRLDVFKTDFRPGTLKHSSLKLLGAPTYATHTGTRTIQRRLQEMLKSQRAQFQHELGWYIDPSLVTNVYQWIVELHSFDPTLPLAVDLKNANISSIVTEIRFPPDFPILPPFVRIIRPRLLSLASGGGGHITLGGSMCMELLTTSGWSPASSIESVLVQVRMALSNPEPQPARLDRYNRTDYAMGDAWNDFKRVCRQHGWDVPRDLDQISWM